MKVQQLKNHIIEYCLEDMPVVFIIDTEQLLAYPILVINNTIHSVVENIMHRNHLKTKLTFNPVLGKQMIAHLDTLSSTEELSVLVPMDQALYGITKLIEQSTPYFEISIL